jgi:regulator of protease activity HflC (stomatin/prohibitin superfamily)
MGAWVVVVVFLVVLLVALAIGSLRIVKEYERGVAFRLGRLRGPLGPGIVVVVPGIDKLVRVELRTVTLTIPPQEVITRDNVTARVNAVVLFRVTDPTKSVMGVENFAVATSQIAQTTLRSVVGRADLDTLLAHRADLNEDLAESIAKQTEPWGILVEVVEIKDVEIPEMMQRAMAREAEAERERRAKVISAHGELQASAELRDAAITLSEPRVAAAALSADPARTRRRPEFDGRLPSSDGYHPPVPRRRAEPDRRRGRFQRRCPSHQKGEIR